MTYPQGSVWRKWDLHIHTPYSKNNTNKQDWEKFISELENCDIDVIGINDYSLIDGYEKVKEHQKNSHKLKNKIIFPVIEYRVNKFSSNQAGDKWKKINLHIIFDPNLTSKEIKKYITDEVNKKSTGSNTKYTTLEDFSNSNQKPHELCIDYDNFIKKISEYQNNPDHVLHNKFLIGLGYSEWDKVFTDKTNNEDHKKDFLAKANFLFSSSDEEKYSKKKDTIKTHFDIDFPILNASDKHNLIEKSGHCNDFSKYSWIKADTTFEGLKTTLLEPNSRIKVQKESPYNTTNKSHVINKIVFPNDSNIITHNDEIKELTFNQDLVCIIGNKGAGKSLLGHIIASKFDSGLKNNYNEIQNIDSCTIELKAEITPSKENIYYISQDYINSLSHIDNPEIDNILKRIIFAYADDVQKLQINNEKTTDFRKDYINTLNEYNTFLRDNLNIPQEITSIELSITNNRKLYKSNKTELDNIKEECKDSQDIKLYYKNIEDIKTLEEKEKTLTEQIQNIDNVNNIINTFKSQVDDIQNEINQNIKGIDNVDKNNFLIKINSEELLRNYRQTKESIIKEQTTLKKDLDTFKGSNQLLSEKLGSLIDTKYIENLTNNIRDLETKHKNLLKEKEKYKDLNKKYEEYQQKHKNLFIEYIKKQYQYQSTLEEVQKNINTKIQSLTTKLQKDEKFKDLEKEINKINFKVEAESKTQIDNFCDSINDYLKNQKTNTTLQIDTIKKHLNTNQHEIESLYNYLFEFSLNKDLQFKVGSNKEQFYFDIFNIQIKYKYELYYDDRPFSQISSAGQKGTAVLLLLLLLDKEYKNRILIIDQPEDNLDNRTIHNVLVPAFQLAKEDRQIFLITHNANLAINTDCEQVIVAEDKKDKKNQLLIHYQKTGSLENKEIKEQCCSILEGGETAFKHREKKYNI